LRLVAVPAPGAESGRLGFRWVPEDSVPTGSLRTRIPDGSEKGPSPAPERGREPINPSLDLVPSARRDRLHDPRREPTDRAPDWVPVEGVPVGRSVGSRTSRPCCRRHLGLSPCVGWPRFSRDGTPEGRQPAFAARGSCPWGDSPAIRSTPDRRWLVPSSLLRGLISVLSSSPSQRGRPRGDFVPLRDQHPGLRSGLSAGGASSATGDGSAPNA
jgi:hypothetical protein